MARLMEAARFESWRRAAVTRRRAAVRGRLAQHRLQPSPVAHGGLFSVQRLLARQVRPPVAGPFPPTHTASKVMLRSMEVQDGVGEGWLESPCLLVRQDEAVSYGMAGLNIQDSMLAGAEDLKVCPSRPPPHFYTVAGDFWHAAYGAGRDLEAGLGAVGRGRWRRWPRRRLR